MNPEPISISVVVPVYNEESSVESLHREICLACERGLDGTPFDYEIIFVNDGSTDGTDAVCKKLSPLKYICFRKNFGQTAALDCGFHAAKGDFVAALDGDGQNDPADIPMMLRYLIENRLDVMSGWRKDRQDTAGKRFVSRGANLLRTLLVHDGIHDSGCTLKVYRRECFEDLDLYGEQHRFIPALLELQGWRVGEVPVHHRKRMGGRSKYGVKRILHGLIDMLSIRVRRKYGSRPQHLLGGIGLVTGAAGVLSALIAVIGAVSGKTDARFWVLLAVMLCGAGFGSLALGFLSETLLRNSIRAGQKRCYAVAETVERKNGGDAAL